MQDMTTTLNVYNAMQQFQRGMKTNIVHWQKANPDAWGIVTLIQKLEREHGR